MRPKTHEMMKKVKDALIDNPYQTSIDLSKKTGLSRGRIFQLVRKMRLDNIGVMPTSKGYVLSQYATKPDDVNFIRRIYGRRTSDFIAVKACQKDINGRWKSIEERKLLQDMVSPLSADLSSSKGMKALLTCQEKFETDY